MPTAITPTVVLRGALSDAIGSGVMGMTTHDLNRLIEDQCMTPSENNRHLLTGLLKKEHNWTISRVFGGASVYHDRLIPPELLEDLKSRCVAETKACRDGSRAKSFKKTSTGGLPIGVSREEFKKMILEEAAHPTRDLELYVYRAARACGVVRGINWPR